jgi:hypothetical protein
MIFKSKVLLIPVIPVLLSIIATGSLVGCGQDGSGKENISEKTTISTDSSEIDTGWLNLTVTGIPEETLNINASMLDGNGKTIIFDKSSGATGFSTNVKAGQTEWQVNLLARVRFIPGEYTIQVSATERNTFKKTNVELKTLIKTGANDIRLGLDKPVTKFKLWVTTTKESSTPPVTSIKIGSVSEIYIWIQVETGQTTYYVMKATLQDGTLDYLARDQQWPGEPSRKVSWRGNMLSVEGQITIDAFSIIDTFSETGEKIGYKEIEKIASTTLTLYR